MTGKPLTAQGAERLKEELAHLKSKVRPQIINAIAEAREHGDLKENAEYHAAREQQSFVEGRIATLESQLSTARIIDITTLKNDGKVVFGTTVKVENIETGQSLSYQIVGELESDISHNRISVTSPIARALIGKQEGDIAVVDAPGGEIEYEIVKVSYL